MQWVFLNGELVEEGSAAVPALDRGLLYGHGLFETMRAYDGHPFRLEEHYSRLCRGARLLGVEVPLALPELREAIATLLRRAALSDAYLRLTVTAGMPPGPDGARRGQGAQVLLQARQPAGYPEETYRRGMAAVTSQTRRNETSPLCGVKSLNYLDNLLARDEARRQGAEEALLLNSRGLGAEGSASNLFLVRDACLTTPSVSSGALPGVTRAAVLELATEAGLEPQEAAIEPSAVLEASEVFLTNSLMEVMPLTRLDGQPIGAGRPGPVTRRVLDLYRRSALAGALPARAADAPPQTGE